MIEGLTNTSELNFTARRKLSESIFGDRPYYSENNSVFREIFESLYMRNVMKLFLLDLEQKFPEFSEGVYVCLETFKKIERGNISGNKLSFGIAVGNDISYYKDMLNAHKYLLEEKQERLIGEYLDLSLFQEKGSDEKHKLFIMRQTLMDIISFAFGQADEFDFGDDGVSGKVLRFLPPQD